VAERITTALDAGASDIRQLSSAAYGHSVTASTPPRPDLEWVGRKAFETQHGNIRGIDRDYGMRWGRRSNQRISLRLDGDEATHGLLYAYDPVWQEYAVLSTTAQRSAVDRAFAHALDTDIHMSVEDFTELVGTYGAALDSASAETQPCMQVQL
jgi:hypothetical protein